MGKTPSGCSYHPEMAHGDILPEFLVVMEILNRWKFRNKSKSLNESLVHESKFSGDFR
jgi:hypothetical protein